MIKNKVYMISAIFLSFSFVGPLNASAGSEVNLDKMFLDFRESAMLSDARIAEQLSLGLPKDRRWLPFGSTNVMNQVDQAIVPGATVRIGGKNYVLPPTQTVLFLDIKNKILNRGVLEMNQARGKDVGGRLAKHSEGLQQLLDELQNPSAVKKGTRARGGGKIATISGLVVAGAAAVVGASSSSANAAEDEQNLEFEPIIVAH